MLLTTPDLSLACCRCDVFGVGPRVLCIAAAELVTCFIQLHELVP